MDDEPEYLQDYAEELTRLGLERFVDTYRRPVLVAIGLLGGIQDREAGDMRATMQADQASELRKPQSIQFRVFPLRKAAHTERGVQVTVGRSPENDIVVPEYSLSAQHCGFTYNAQFCEVVDFNSRNGTILNGTRLKPGDVTRVKDKDTIVLGRLKFRLLLRDSLAKLVKSMPPMSSRSRA